MTSKFKQPHNTLQVPFLLSLETSYIEMFCKHEVRISSGVLNHSDCATYSSKILECTVH